MVTPPEDAEAKMVADAIRLAVRQSAGIAEGEEFRCDWDQVAKAATDVLKAPTSGYEYRDTDHAIGFCADYRHPDRCYDNES